MLKHYKLVLILFTALFVGSCQENELLPLEAEEPADIEFAMDIVGEIPAEITYGEQKEESNVSDTFGIMMRGGSIFERVETGGSKTGYAAANVSLYSGSWYMSDALIGTSTSDRKNGNRSVRIVNNGVARTNFNFTSGISTVVVRHAKFGSDANSSWRLVVSYDNGSSWYFAGSTINTTSTSLQTVTITLQVTQSVRLGVYKTGGGSARINIDDIEVRPQVFGSPARDSNLTFGNPSNAGTTAANNYLISRTEYALSYNNSKGKSNWVSWHLSSAWFGSATRKDNFVSDPALPSNYFKAVSGNYTNTGFNRGHLCPSADRTYTQTANDRTFFMTNIAPQSPRNNQQTWANLEAYCRKLANEGYELHIIAGSVGRGGTGSNGYYTTIASGNIEVPSSFWKAVLIIPNGTNDVNRVTTATRVIAVNIPNDQSHNTAWGNHRVSVRQIENLAGINLFSNLSTTIQNVIETRVDNGPTN